MGNLIEKVIYFLKHEDVFDVVYTFLLEHRELLLVVAAVLFILLLSLWTIAERLQKRGAIVLVPVYRFMVLFQQVGMKKWLGLLMIVPGVNLVLRAVFYVRIAQKFNRSYIFVPLLYIFPLIFLPIVAFGDGKCVRLNKAEKNGIAKTRRMEKRNAKLQKQAKGWRKQVAKAKPAAAETEQAMFDVVVAEIAGEAASSAHETRHEDVLMRIPVSETGEKTRNRKIDVIGRNVDTEARVLTMAELRRKRAEGRSTKKTPPKQQKLVRKAKDTMIGPAGPDRSLPKPTAQIAAEKDIVRPKADCMPTIKQGRRGMEIEKQKKIAEANQGTEYDRLLRKQQVAQEQRRRATTRAKQGRQNIDIARSTVAKSGATKKKAARRKIQ